MCALSGILGDWGCGGGGAASSAAAQNLVSPCEGFFSVSCAICLAKRKCSAKGTFQTLIVSIGSPFAVIVCARVPPPLPAPCAWKMGHWRLPMLPALPSLLSSSPKMCAPPYSNETMVGMSSEVWAIQEFIQLQPKLCESLLKGAAKCIASQSALPLLFAAERAFLKLANSIEPWADTARRHHRFPQQNRRGRHTRCARLIFEL